MHEPLRPAGCPHHATHYAVLLFLAAVAITPPWCTSSRALSAADESPSHHIQHNYSLPLPLLQSAQGSVVPTMQLCKLYDVLQRGNGTLRMAVVGGSYSASRGHIMPWVGHVEHALRASFPELSISVRNAARGGTDPSYTLPCLRALLPGHEPWDVVFIEFNPNSIRKHYHPHAGRHNLEALETWEGLLRACLELPGSPLVVLFQAHMPMVWMHDHEPITFYDHNEEGMGLVASYYNIPMLSMRNALWQLQRAEVPGFRDNDTRQSGDKWHYNSLGAKYAADAVVYFLTTVLPRIVVDTSRCSDPSLQHNSSIANSLDGASRYPVMFPPKHDLSHTLLCATMERLVSHVRGDSNWTFGELNGLADRLGFFTSAVGAQLNFTWEAPPLPPLLPVKSWMWNRRKRKRTKRKKRPKLPSFEVTFWIFCSNKSHWGSGRLACLLGCTCKPLEFSAVWSRLGTASAPITINVRPVSNVTCVMQLTVLKGPQGGTLLYFHSVSVAHV